MARIYSYFLTLLIATLSGCAPVAQIRYVKPHDGPLASGSRTSIQAQDLIVSSDKLAAKDPARAIGGYLTAARASDEQLKTHPGDRQAITVYNTALSRMFSVFRTAKINPWLEPLRVSGFTLARVPDRRAMWNPADYDLIPCDEIQVSGEFFPKPVRREGVGAMLLAVRTKEVKNYKEQFLSSGHVYYGVTAIARFEGDICRLSLVDPLASPTVSLNGRTYPLAGDFSTAPAMMLVKDHPQNLGFARMIDPAKYTGTRRLFRLQPYDPKKIPVLLVHGLQDTSATWIPLFNEMMSDPEIRQRCQFWFYSYPSGDPFPYSAIFLRQDLDAIERAFPDHLPIVIVGHSMGGLVTRLMISDPGDSIWIDIFKTKPSETHLPADLKTVMEKALIFERRPEIERAVFMSTPHRGSVIASNWIGRIATRLVHLPLKLAKMGKEMAVAAVELKLPDAKDAGMPTSIDTLSPSSRFLVAMNKVPPSPAVPFHQIMGDRGRGDTPDSSDGVVGYWSSHLDGAQSTKIVPSGHLTNRNPEGIAEVKRILKLQLERPRD